MARIYLYLLLIFLNSNVSAQDLRIDLIEQYNTSSTDYPKKIKRQIKRSQKKHYKESGLDIVGENMISGLIQSKRSKKEFQNFVLTNQPISKYELFLDRIILNERTAELKQYLKVSDLVHDLNLYVYPIYSRRFNGVAIPYGSSKKNWFIEVNYADKNISYLASILSTGFKMEESNEDNDTWSIKYDIPSIKDALDTLRKYPDIQSYFDDFLGYYFLKNNKNPDYFLIYKHSSSLSEAFFETFFDGSKILFYHENSHAILQHDITSGTKEMREFEADSLAIDLMKNLEIFNNPFEVGSVAMGLIMPNLRSVMVEGTAWNSDRIFRIRRKLEYYGLNMFYFNYVYEIIEFLWENSRHNPRNQNISQE